MHPIDIIDSPLWDIEGYITKVRIGHIPMVVRLETTTMLLTEILDDKTPVKNSLNEIETHFMELANGFVFDSWSIFRETERLYQFNFSSKPYAVIHHGIDVSDIENKEEASAATVTGKVHVLIAGRLEKRKGSNILVKEILPTILNGSNNTDIIFHIVGKDSGEWDGFMKETGAGYHDYIRKNFKRYLDKQIFIYGYVSDEQLEELYSSSDIVLALSRYESFGLLYIEAMKKGKPLIVFNTGAVPEIFENNQDAIIIPIDKPKLVAEAIFTLKNSPELRKKLSINAMEKLKNRFSSELMGKNCAAFFEEIVFRRPEERIFQAMNCLTDRDGVSNTTVDYDNLLKTNGAHTQIIGSYASEPVKHLSQKIENIQFSNTDYVIYHYWNFCEKAEYFNGIVLPKKIFFFHNITHPNFFHKEDEAYPSTLKGYEQLSMFDNFDLYVCHSNYSASVLRQAIQKTITTLIIPPIVDPKIITERPYDYTFKKIDGSPHIIFVGSIAPHKKQTDILRFFQYYVNKVNPSATLTIAGGGSPKYVKELQQLLNTLKLGPTQVKITGKISDSQLYALYRTADVFLSMSEHEGFGVPLAEAMAFDIPVVAYNSTAVPETVGENGCLFDKKNNRVIAEIIEKLKDVQFREEVIRKQREHLKRFSPAAIFKSFEDLKIFSTENYKLRITRKLKQGPLLIDELYLCNDKRLNIQGATKIVDDNLLLIDPSKEESFITIEDEFNDFEVSFLTHPWSGKVLLSVDNENEQEFDLYSTKRRIKSFKIENISPGVHELLIKPTGNKNELAQGNEVFFEKLILRKPLQNGEKKNGTVVNAKSDKSNLNDELNSVKVETVAQTEAENEEIIENEEYRYLLQPEEIISSHPSLRYNGNWSVKELYFHYTDAKSESSTIEFEGEFSFLDLTFLTHDWSGKVLVKVDNAYTEILNLYSFKNAEKTFRLGKQFSFKEHTVLIKTLREKDIRSKGYEVFFKGVTAIQKCAIKVDDDTLKEKYKVSIIINTLNRATHLKALLKDLEKQTYPYYEIVAVNGPSTDNTKEVLKKYEEKIKIIHCPEANLSMSRNLGIENSGGDYVAFIDDDALPSDEKWLENFIWFLVYNSDRNIGTVGGPVKHKDTQHYEFKNGATSDYGMQIFREEELKTHILDGKRWVQGVPGGNNVTSKKALYDIGGFDERFIYYLDETDMCIRLARKGYYIANSPISYIRHFKAPSNMRKSAFEIRWDIIARSDTFYCLKNGHDLMIIRLIRVLTGFRKKHFFIEVGKAYKEGKIDRADYKRYRKMLRKGFWQGIRWGVMQPRDIDYLKSNCTEFHLFPKESVFLSK
ncbi:MAG: glycosyltransferase [Bacteroidetes bacterium]|nr:glycosyltransferase [Bacteroidota bacterium]